MGIHNISSAENNNISNVIEGTITTYSDRSGETAEGSSNKGYSTHEVDGMPAARTGRTRNAHKTGNERIT